MSIMSIEYFSFYLQIIQTVALVSAVVIAWFAIKSQKETTKKEKTISLLAKDLEFLEGMDILRKITTEDIAIDSYAEKVNQFKKETIEIRRLLNYCEDISIGVLSKIYNFEMIKKSRKTTLTGIYNKAKPFIIRLREQDKNPNLYIEFENFVNIINA